MTNFIQIMPCIQITEQETIIVVNYSFFFKLLTTNYSSSFTLTFPLVHCIGYTICDALSWLHVLLVGCPLQGSWKYMDWYADRRFQTQEYLALLHLFHILVYSHSYHCWLRGFACRKYGGKAFQYRVYAIQHWPHCIYNRKHDNPDCPRHCPNLCHGD